MTRDDEDQFLDYVRSLGNLAILPISSPDPNFAPVEKLPEPSEDEATRRYWLQYTGARMQPIAEQDPEKGDYVIDGFQSPVVLFWRSRVISRVMLPGGIETDLTYIDDETSDLAKKPVEFQRWFESIEKWIHKNYSRLGIYVFAGPGALKFREEGGFLQGR